MAKINVEAAKQRIKKQNIYSASKLTQTKKKEEIEYVDTVNDNIFIFKTNNSYVLSPADDTLNPIIGEFDEIPDDNSMPPCLQDWLNTYSNEINYFQENEPQILSELATDEMLKNSDNNIFGLGTIELVDLGLSVKWATTNLGATKPEEIGNYYAWGETDIKTSYTASNYKFYDSSTKTYNSIGNNISKNINYDPAYKLDINLCMPTEQQFKELIDNCIWTKKTFNNVKGWEVKGPNNKTIFLPLTGCISESSKVTYNDYCYLWTSDAYIKTTYQARTLKVTDNPDFYSMYKRTGAPIRPVASTLTDNKNKIKLVDLGLTVNWADMNLGAESPEESGDYFAWGELNSKTDFTWDNYKWNDSTGSSYKSKDLGKNISKNELYDPAYNFNNMMCLPTDEQWNELLTKCKLIDKTINNKKVCEIIGPNGNSIILPYAGYKTGTTLTKYNAHCCYDTANTYSTNTNMYNKTLNMENGNNRIAYSRKMLGKSIRPVSVKTNSVKKTIQPLIPYKWGQSAPYYNLLPKDPSTGKTVATGCSNTAMAMIVAYYGCIGINGKKFRRGCLNTTKYVSKSGTKSQQTIPALNSITIFDYDNMNFIKTADFKTTESKQAVAELMKYIGYASKANYSSSGTGTPVPNSLSCASKNLNLGPKAQIIYASSGLSAFKEKIYKELEQGYPVNFYGWNSSNTSAHAFICDGYDATTGKYHFNWGWSGNYNGWFEISALTPATKDFSYFQRCIIGLHPEFIFGDTNNDGNVSVTDVMNIVQSIIDKKTYNQQFDINSDGKITEDDVQILVDYILGNNIR